MNQELRPPISGVLGADGVGVALAVVLEEFNVEQGAA